MPFREQDSTLPTDTGGSQGKVALNELGRVFEEPLKAEMPFDMGSCSEEGLRDLNVSSTLTFGVDCIEQITLKSWRKSFGFFFLRSSALSGLSKACSKRKNNKTKPKKQQNKTKKTTKQNKKNPQGKQNKKEG